MVSEFWVDIVTLLSILNPIAIIPLFLTITARLDAAERARVLLRAVVISLVILLVFLALGEIALKELGVSLDSFRVAGGLVLLLISLRMIFDEGRDADDDHDATAVHRDIAVFPLAMPVIAGPGAMLAVVLLTENDVHDIEQQAVTAAALVVVLAINYLTLKGASTVQRLLGDTGISVMSRIAGLILAALAAQTMLTGIRNTLLK